MEKVTKANYKEIATVEIRTPILTGIISEVLGILLIALRNFITGPGIMITGGVIFILAGLVNFGIALLIRDEEGRRKSRGWIFALTCAVSVASVGLGICIFVFQDTFVGLIPILIGTLLALLAVMLFYTLIFAMRRYAMPGWLYVAPTLVAVCSAIVFTFNSPVDDYKIMTFTGIGFILYGICHFFGALMLRKAHYPSRKGEAVAGSADDEHRELKSLDDEQ